MKKIYLTSLFVTFTLIVFGQRSVDWVSTTEAHAWKQQKQLKSVKKEAKTDVVISTQNQLQTIEGFGGCFNELGWTSLNSMSSADKEAIFKELFSPNGGANFTVCRMPVGANDFSLDWYSYDETEGDFELKNFSIDHDRQTLVPFIKEAQRFNPNLKIWASPWSPPSWMKWNKHYACASTGNGMAEKFRNQLAPDRQGKEGTNMFIQEAPYFKAYAKY